MAKKSPRKKAKKAVKKTAKKAKKKTVKKTVKRKAVSKPSPKIVCGPCKTLSIRSMALAFGIVYAIVMGALALVGMYVDLGQIGKLMADIYPGFAFTWPGVLIGALWGFILGAIFGWLLAALYNAFR